MPDGLRSALPDWAVAPVEWLLSPSVLAIISVASIALFVASLVGVPWFLKRLPADFFVGERPSFAVISSDSPALRTALRVGRNAVGVVLLLTGVAMLVLPGQGLVTIFVSLVLLDFPGKRRLQRRIVFSPKVFRTINRLRERAGEAPLERDDD